MRRRSNPPSKMSILLKDIGFKISIMINAFCIFLLFMPEPSLIGQFKFLISGIKTEAKVLDIRSYTVRYKESGGKSITRYKVKYQFTTEDGKNINNDITVSNKIGSDLKKGENFKIIYDSDDTGKTQVYEKTLEYLLGLSLVMSFHSLIGILLLYSSIKRANRVRRLFRIGIDAKATVSDIRVTGRTNNRPSAATVEYTFEYRENKHYEGRTKSVPYKNTLNIRTGDEINILYNPKNPDETVWLDGCF